MTRQLPRAVIGPTLILALVLGLVQTQAQARPIKLNAPLGLDETVADNPFWAPEVNFLHASPDGKWVVYHTAINDDWYEYFIVPAAGGRAQPLYPLDDYIGGGGVFNSDSQWWVGSAMSRYGGYGIYSRPIPIGRGDPIQLTPPGLARAPDFTLSSDGRRVLYLLDANGTGLDELYSVPVSGGEIIKLNPPLPEEQEVTRYLVSADGARVAFIVGGGEPIRNSVIYSVSTTGGVPVVLHDAGTPTVLSLQAVVGDDSRVIYSVSGDGLYGVPIEGGPPVLIYSYASSGAAGWRQTPVLIDPVYPSARYSADGRWRVFLVENSDYVSSTHDVYSISLVDGTRRQLNLPGMAADDHFLITPDSSRVLFTARSPDGTGWYLYSVPPSGGDIENLGGMRVQYNFGRILSYFEITPDSSRAVGYFVINGDCRLASVCTTAGTPVVLNPTGMGAFYLTSDSKHVVFHSLLPPHEDKSNIYAVPVGGGRPRRLSELGAGQSVSGYCILTPNGRRVLYTVEQPDGETVELFSNTIRQACLPQGLLLNEPAEEAPADEEVRP